MSSKSIIDIYLLRIETKHLQFTSFSFLPCLKTFDDDERNHAVARDEEINKFVCPAFFLLLLLHRFFSHLLIATLLPSSQCVSFSNRILSSSSSFQETNTLSLKLFSFRTNVFICFVTNHAVGLLLFRCHYGRRRGK